jgi:hypothetical protein
MPDLDVSFMTTDPMLADTFTVVRRNDVVDQRGRTTPTTTATTPNVVGVVTQQDPADLMRRDDGQMVPRLIFIATMFQVRGASTGLQPDQILWNGTTYTVLQVYPYSRFGRGTYEVVAEAMNATDSAQ